MGTFQLLKQSQTHTEKTPNFTQKMRGFESQFASMFQNFNPEMLEEMMKQFPHMANIERNSVCQNSVDKNRVCIPLKRFTPESVKVNLNKTTGLLTVSASCENVKDLENRNGKRKTTVVVEETCQLPSYLIENDLLGKVESRFDKGHLVVEYPIEPKELEKRKEEAKKGEPVEIPIMME